MGERSLRFQLSYFAKGGARAKKHGKGPNRKSLLAGYLLANAKYGPYLQSMLLSVFRLQHGNAKEKKDEKRDRRK